MAEKNTIVLISEIQGYMILSVRDKLEEAGYEVIIVRADIEKINKIEGRIGAYLLYGDEELVEKQQTLIYIKDRSAEKDIPIFMIGSEEEKEAIKNWIPSHLMRQFFERPINIKELVKAVDDYVIHHGADQKKKVLVVDDSGAMLRNVKAWLEDKYQVILANSGAMAIKYLATNRPDLVLLDYEMPVVNGKQVLQMIRTETEFSDVPVIFLTGKDDRQSVMEVMALKPDGYLLKTMEPDKIIAEVDAFFEKQKARNSFV